MSAMAVAPPYVELHCHSAYSFLDGVSLPDELAARAHELGYEALALTDHNSVSGSMELALSAEQYGLRAIHGAEIDLTPASGARGGHLTLLVKDDRGWRSLCRIITLAHAGTRDGARRRDPAAAAIGLQDVLDHAEGLICLTGCAARSVLREGLCEEATGRARDARAVAAADVRSHAGPWVPLSGRRGPRRVAVPGRAVRRAPARALQRWRAGRGEGAAGARAARDRTAGAGWFLLAAPRHARAGARGGGGGAGGGLG